jgi:hypothetical protein
VLTWEKARCCSWVRLEVWPEATSLAVVAAHTPPFDRKVNAIGIEHSVLVQGAIGGAVPGPVDAM